VNSKLVIMLDAAKLLDASEMELLASME